MERYKLVLVDGFVYSSSVYFLFIFPFFFFFFFFEYPFIDTSIDGYDICNTLIVHHASFRFTHSYLYIYIYIYIYILFYCSVLVLVLVHIPMLLYSLGTVLEQFVWKLKAEERGGYLLFFLVCI